MKIKQYRLNVEYKDCTFRQIVVYAHTIKELEDIMSKAIENELFISFEIDSIKTGKKINEIVKNLENRYCTDIISAQYVAISNSYRYKFLK